MRDVRLVDTSFDPNALTGALTGAATGSGGVASFTGLVRGGEGIEALELSHYEPLTLPNMEELADEASARFGLDALVMVHRTGRMAPGEAIVCVAAASPHRRDAINAVDFCMDHLKSAAWFWKRELRNGEWSWIEPRSEDYSDLARWDAK